MRSDVGFLDRFRTPKTPASPGDLDRMILGQLRSLGSDLALPRHVVHYSYFPDQARAQAAAAEVSRSGHEAEARPPAAGYPDWCVVAEITAVVDETTVDATRALFEQVAASHEGAYDGWEAAGEP